MIIEWTLIGCTVAFQWAVGIMLMYHLFLYYPLFIKKSLPPTSFKLIPLISSFIAIIGLVLSFIHHPNPSSTFQSIENIGSVWLSVEPFLVILYCIILLFLLSAHHLWKDYKRRIRWMLNGVNLIGILLIFVMSMVYYLPTQPAWHNLFTPLNFCLSMLLLGAATILLFQTTNGSMASQKSLAVLFIVVSSVFLVIIPVQMTYLSDFEESTRFSVQVQLNDYPVLFYVKVCLLLLALIAGIWSRTRIRSATSRNQSLILPTFLALITSLSFVIIDRILFYLQAL